MPILLNAQGQPVATKQMMIQLELPAEEATTIKAIDFFGLISAVMALVAALATGNPVTIMNAIQAFIKALMGG